MLYRTAIVMPCTCGIMLISGYEGQTSTETTREYNKLFVLGSYLDTFHTQPDVSIALGYELEMRVVLSYKCRAFA